MGTTMKRETQYVPKNYDELYSCYIENDKGGDTLVKMLLRRFLPYASEEDRRELQNQVFVHAMENRLIAIYDPTKANFGGAIFFVVRTVAVRFLRKRSRDPLTGLKAGSLIETTNLDPMLEMGSYPIDHYFKTSPWQEEKVISQEIVERLRELVRRKSQKPRSVRDKHMMSLLQLMEKEYDTQEIAQNLGVAVSTVHNWISWLRTQTKTIMEQLA